MSYTNIQWDSELYQSKHAFVYQYGRELIKLLNPQPQEFILDLGCGAGQLTSAIADLGAYVIGAGNSESMIIAAKKNFPALDFRLLNAANFNFDGTLDAIFSNATLHWVTPPGKAVACMINSLKTGGRLVAEFGGNGNNRMMIQVLKKAMRQQGHTRQAEIDFWYFPSVSEYTSLLERQGFEVHLACLFDRPTPLSGNDGPKDWFRMFGEKFFTGMAQKDIENVLDETQKLLQPTNFTNGAWYADYRRLRIIAVKQ